MRTKSCFGIAVATVLMLQFCGCQFPAASVFEKKELGVLSSDDPLAGFPASLLVKDAEKFMKSKGFECTYHFNETLHYRDDMRLVSEGRSTPQLSDERSKEHCTYLKCTLTTRSGLVSSWLALMFVFDPASGKITNQARDWSATGR